MKDIYAVLVPSAYRFGHLCLIGRGATKKAALEDAYGPSEYWSARTRSQARRAEVRLIDEAEFHRFMSDA